MPWAAARSLLKTVHRTVFRARRAPPNPLRPPIMEGIFSYYNVYRGKRKAGCDENASRKECEGFPIALALLRIKLLADGRGRL